MRTDDGYMVYRCLNGDSSAFGFLVDKYRESVYALAYSRLRNFHDAQDIVQEVFIRAYENLHKLRRWDSFASWLYRIALSLCSRWVRSHSRRPDREFIEDQEPGVSETHSMDSYRESLMYGSLHEALDSLAEIHREVLTLHYFGGMTSSEIARFTGVSPAAVRKRLARARSLLKAEMFATIREVFEKQELPAGFTLRILEMVKHIRVQPLPRLAELGWGLSIALGVMIAVLGSGSFIKLQNYVDSAASGTTGPTGMGEIPVIIFEQTSEREGDASMLKSKKISIATVFTAMLGILSGNAMAQTEWIKYDANPLLPKGAGGTWDDEGFFKPSVLFLPGSAPHPSHGYKMYYGAYDGSDWSVGLATSENGIDWVRHTDDNNNPVPLLSGEGSGWDHKSIDCCAVILDEGLYKAWYSGTEGSSHKIGYATSTDGIIWHKYDGDNNGSYDPVLDKGVAWESKSVYWPAVLIVENAIPCPDRKYKMWYSATDGSNRRIGLATSEDGIIWEKYDKDGDGNPDPVLEPTVGWEGVDVFAPTVLYDGTIYRMWYVGHDGSHGRIGYATSGDGILWHKYYRDDDDNPDPVLDLGEPGEWDNFHVNTPSVLLDGVRYKMWYVGSNGSVSGIGYATAPMGNVYIDIKPGSYPNSVNLGSNGVVPVAILSSEDFDATTVDPEYVSLSGAGVAVRGKGNKLMTHEEDVNGDGLLDLVVQVETENLIPGEIQNGYAVLTGKTQDGQEIEGWDEINIVPVDGDAAPADSTGSEAFAVFPQPANPELWIPYKLAQDVDVTITIRNISGRTVRTLNLGHQPAGLYVSRDKAAHWDGRNEAGEQVSSGIYFYTIQAGDYTATRKMIIAR